MSNTFNDITIASIKPHAIHLGAWSNLTPVAIQPVLGGPTLEVGRIMYLQPTPEHPLGRIVLVPEQQETPNPQETPQS